MRTRARSRARPRHAPRMIARASIAVRYAAFVAQRDSPEGI
jgi:hypothetical protein